MSKNAAGITLVESNLKDYSEPLNKSLNEIRELLRDYRDVSMVGTGDYTLSKTDANPEARTAKLRLTGAQTVSRNILVDPSEGLREFTILNSTTEGGSSTTATIKTTAGGSAGVIIPRGFQITVWHDGTNFHAKTIPLDTAGRVPQVRAYSSVNQSLANGIDTPILLNSERWDVGGFHSTASNTSRFTVPAGLGGLYVMGNRLRFASNATGYRYAFLRHNGTDIFDIGAANALNGLYTPVGVGGTQWRLADGEYIETLGGQSSGGALNVEASNKFSPEMWMMMVGL